MATRMEFQQIAAQYLREQGVDILLWGDLGFIHDIVDRAGEHHRGPETCKWALDRLEGSPLFDKRLIRLRCGTRGAERWCRAFKLKSTSLGH